MQQVEREQVAWGPVPFHAAVERSVVQFGAVPSPLV